MPINQTNRPSYQLNELLAGRVSWEQADPAIQSWARFYIWRYAEQIVALPTLEQRRKAIASMPETIRDRIKDQVKIMWEKTR